MRTIVTGIAVAVLAGILAALTYLVLSQSDQAAELSTSLDSLERRIKQLEASSNVPLAQTSPFETQHPPSPELKVETPDQEPATLFGPGRTGLAVMQQLRDPSIDPEIRLERARELVNSPIPPAQFMAIATLIELQDDQAVDAVRNLVEAAVDGPMARRMAERAVDLLAEADGNGADTLLYEYLDHEDTGISMAAARSLEARGDSSPINEIIDDLAVKLRDKDGGVRGRAVRELGRTASSAAVEPLTIAMEDANSEVRMLAARALGQTGDESAIEQLTVLLDDPITEVRSAAVRSLDRIRNPESNNNRRQFFGRF